MVLTVPDALKSLSTAGSALKMLVDYRKRTRGNVRVLLGEIKDNLAYLDMVAEDGVPLGEVLPRISNAEYKRLAREGFDFNSLKGGKIKPLASLAGTDLAPWVGKDASSLIESIYDKIADLLIRYPFVAGKYRYRWGVRVNNIRKRIWLLLRHLKD